jgi:cellulose biosynthesis protein BcsQ
VPVDAAGARSFLVVSVVNPKGGVGKTTLATNLAVYLRALAPELEVLLLGLDDQSMIDRMFATGEAPARTWRTVAAGLRRGELAVVGGRHGVHYVPSARDIGELNRTLEDPRRLERALARTGWRGIVVIDTKGDLEILTVNALLASDLVLVPVRDDTSLREARKVFERLREWGLPRERARVVLCMVDLRVRYRQEVPCGVHDLLLSELARLGLPSIGTLVSQSPVVEALSTSPGGRPLPILEGAPHSVVHRQMLELGVQVLKALGREAEPAAATALLRVGGVKRRLLRTA